MENFDFSQYNKEEEKPKKMKKSQIVSRESKSRITKIPSKKPVGLKKLEEKFETFKLEITKKIENLSLQQNQNQNQKSVPDAVLKSLTKLLNADYKRFTKWNYTGYITHVEIIADFFKIQLK